MSPIESYRKQGEIYIAGESSIYTIPLFKLSQVTNKKIRVIDGNGDILSPFTVEKSNSDYPIRICGSNNVLGFRDKNYNLITDFEDFSNLNVIQNTSRVESSNKEFWGDQSVVFTNDVDDDPGIVESYSGLNNYPERGQVFDFRFYFPSDSRSVHFFWCKKEDQTLSDGSYGIRIHGDDEVGDTLEFAKDFSFETIFNDSLPTDEWIKCEVEFYDPIVLSLYRENGDLIDTGSRSDNEYDSGGIYFWANDRYGDNPVYLDFIKSDPWK